MRAAFITGFGGWDRIEVGDFSVPECGPTDVRVAVEVSPVNQVDTYIRSGAWRTPIPMPFVVGRDLVGTVIDADPVTGFTGGERVWCNSLGHSGRQGACGEQVVVPADRLYHLPEAVDAAAAVAVFHPAATAFLGLAVRVPVRPGDTVFVGGAAGSVGSCAALYAVESGARVVATAGEGDAERCMALGVDAVFDYRDAELPAKLRDAAPDGFDVYWDTSGHAQLGDVAPVMAPGGTIIVTAGREQQPPTALWQLYTNDVSVAGFVISRASTAELSAAARWINRRLAGPGFAVEVARRLPLSRTSEGHRLVELGTRGRVVIDVV
jgi:NADPH:quinone reductase-like Zn-dependent oxidoreductase